MQDEVEWDWLDVVRPAIEEFGWAVMGVFGSDTNPPFTYTVNYTPDVELVIVGMPNRQAHEIMHSAVRAGVDKPGINNDVLDGFAVDVRVVEPWSTEFQPNAARGWRRFMGQPLEFTLLQIVWPDQHGVFPPHPGYASAPQPIIGGS